MPLPPLYGIGGCDGGNRFLVTSAAAGPGLASGFWVSVIVRLNSTSSGDYLISSAPGTSGWLTVISPAPSANFRAADGGGAYQVSPNLTLTTGLVYALVGVFDGSNVRLYSQGAEVGSGSPCVGYTASSSLLYVAAGGALNGFLDFFGCGYGTGVPTPANIADWYDAVQTRRACVDMPGTPATHLWQPTIGWGNMPDLVGGLITLAKVGTGFNDLAIASPQWA